MSKGQALSEIWITVLPSSETADGQVQPRLAFASEDEARGAVAEDKKMAKLGILGQRESKQRVAGPYVLAASITDDQVKAMLAEARSEVRRLERDAEYRADALEREGQSFAEGIRREGGGRRRRGGCSESAESCSRTGRATPGPDPSLVFVSAGKPNEYVSGYLCWPHVLALKGESKADGLDERKEMTQ